MNFSTQYNKYKNIIDKRLSQVTIYRKPNSVYFPIKYILEGTGKRIRPVITMLACESVCGKNNKSIFAATAVEMLHTFTLVHDDVMDNSSTRRGRKTVHKKWDVNTAILVGDEIIALSYKELLKTSSKNIESILKVFTNGIVKVCEGQALDKEFELRKNVILPEYIKMIDMKTGSMVSSAAEIGGIIGGGNSKEILALRKFGESIGRAFQIQDDLLDAISTKKTFGKEVGNDIISGKKTFLLLHAIKKAKGKDYQLLKSVINKNGTSGKNINKVKEIYKRLGIIEIALKAVKNEISIACRHLNKLPASKSREMLFWFASTLLQRKF